MALTPEDVAKSYQSMIAAHNTGKFDIAKLVVLEVRNYPRIYLSVPGNDGSIEDFIQISRLLKLTRE